MGNLEFLAGIKAGDYVKTEYRDAKSVRRVIKVTATQIVVNGWGYGDKPLADRFRISNGCRIGDSWYYQHRIIEDPVSAEEIATYEANIKECTRMREERKRLTEIGARAKAQVVSLFGGMIPAENITVRFISNDGMKAGFFEIKCEKVSEPDLVAALSVDGERVSK